MRHQAQTLIETLAAIFILTMGVTAGVGLANYALGSSNSLKQQFIATGLAREGIEAIKNMRDTNWLQAGTISSNCYDYANTGANDGQCYKNWLTKNIYGSNVYGSIPTYGYPTATINPPASPTSYILSFFDQGFYGPLGLWDPPSPSVAYSYWSLYPQDNQSAKQTICQHISGTLLPFALDFNSSPDNTIKFGAGYYTPTCNSVGTSGFYRQIILSTVTTPPFNQSDSNNDMAELYVQSRVWWTDNKLCPQSTTYPGRGKCSVELDTYLTNWKNY